LFWCAGNCATMQTHNQDRNQGAQNFSLSIEKSVGHSLKLLVIVYKIFATLGKLFVPLVSQAGHGPAHNYEAFQALKGLCDIYTTRNLECYKHRSIGRYFTRGRKNFALIITICPKKEQFALKLIFPDQSHYNQSRRLV